MFFHMNSTVLLHCIYALNFDGCKRNSSPYHFNTLSVFFYIFVLVVPIEITLHYIKTH